MKFCPVVLCATTHIVLTSSMDTPPLPEVNFLMVEIPTLKPYIYSLVSYFFIKQDQVIMTCNSTVASLMLSNIYGLGVGISTIKKFTSGREWGMTLGPEL
jgi:hypothetical protein